MWPAEGLQTTDGRIVEVIDPGLHNRNSGPDFFNAKVKIGGTQWVGNVEIHDRSSHWYQHGHDRDANYNNVVLHVVGEADRDVQTSEGHFVPQMCLKVPQTVIENYEELLRTDSYPPCYRIIPNLTRLTVHSWMAALQTERLEQKTIAISQRAQQANGSWEQAFFITLARNYGFGINGDAFEEWARHIPLQAVGKHRDDLFQIEAIFFGQAGLLELEAVPERYQQAALNEGYFARLRNEYKYLSHKFSLQPMDWHRWRFLRLRPQNFPHIRLAQLANLYYQRRAGLSQLIDCRDMGSMADCLRTQVTPYWETHYTLAQRVCAMPSICRQTRSVCSLLIPVCLCSLPMGGIHCAKSSATVPSTSLSSSKQRKIISYVCGRSADCKCRLPATHKHSYN